MPKELLNYWNRQTSICILIWLIWQKNLDEKKEVKEDQNEENLEEITAVMAIADLEEEWNHKERTKELDSEIIIIFLLIPAKVMDLDLNPIIIHLFQTQTDLVLEDSRLSNLFTLKTDIIIENINLKGNSSNTGKINLMWIINLPETIKH